MAQVAQPHVFFVLSPSNEKVTLSLYTLQVSVPPPRQTECHNGTTFVDESQFTAVVLESKAGTADVVSGIKPDFVNIVLDGLQSVDRHM